MGVDIGLARDEGCMRGVEVLSQVEKAGVVLDHFENLSFSVHHVLVFEDLFHGYYFTSSNDFGLLH